MALHYKIALTNVWWNDEYKDVRRFSSFSDRASYFNLSTIFNDSPAVNLDIKNLNNPRIVFKAPNKNVFDVLNSNYLIVNNTSVETESLSNPVKYYFYFISKIVQDCGDQYIADCKLDDWQTHFLYVNIGSGVIDRVHLNRFIKSGNYLTFDFTEDSPLLITEQPNGTYDKILKKEIALVPSGLSAQIEAWLEAFVACWAYVFIDNNAARKFYTRDPSNDTYTESDITPPDAYYLEYQIKERYSVFCYPIFKHPGDSNPEINIEYRDEKDGTTFIKYASLDRLALSAFIEKNNGYNYIYNLIFSSVNPLVNYLNDSKMSFEISGGSLYLRNSHAADNHGAGIYPIESDEANKRTYVMYPSAARAAFLGLFDVDFVQNQILKTNRNFEDSLNHLEKKNFLVSDIVGAHRKIEYEPKLRQPAYMNITLDIFHVVEKELSFIQFDANIRVKSYISVSPSNNEFKIIPQDQNLGINNNDYSLAISSDLSIPIINTQLENYIANNKTWARIGHVDSSSETSSEWGNIQSFGDFLGAANASIITNPLGLVGKFLSSTVKTDMAKNKPGDLKAAPTNFKGAVAEAFRIGYENQIKTFAKYYQAPLAVLEKDFDYYYYFGYAYGYYKNFSDVLNDSTRRKYFNYIQGKFLAISGNISNDSRRNLTGIFLAGVRIWEIDKTNFDDTLENYELYLDGE